MTQRMIRCVGTTGFKECLGPDAPLNFRSNIVPEKEAELLEAPSGGAPVGGVSFPDSVWKRNTGHVTDMSMFRW